MHARVWFQAQGKLHAGALSSLAPFILAPFLGFGTLFWALAPRGNSCHSRSSTDAMWNGSQWVYISPDGKEIPAFEDPVEAERRER